MERRSAAGGYLAVRVGRPNWEVTSSATYPAPAMRNAGKRARRLAPRCALLTGALATAFGRPGWHRRTLWRMAPIDPVDTRRLLDDIAATSNGTLLEDLITSLFTAIPEVTLHDRDRLSASGSEELDLAFSNGAIRPD